MLVYGNFLLLSKTPNMSFSNLTFKNLIKFLCVVSIVLVLPFNYFSFSTFALGKANNLNLIKDMGIKTAIVPGAQVIGGVPSSILKKRLDRAAGLYNLGLIKNVLVSGDNTDQYYNEPAAMQAYLNHYQGIPSGDIYTDYGGRRTLDTCWRAKNVFNIKKAVIVTQAFHLARATYLCRSVGIEAVPIIAEDAGFESTVLGVEREALASWSAMYDVFINRPATIKPDGKEPDLS